MRSNPHQHEQQLFGRSRAVLQLGRKDAKLASNLLVDAMQHHPTVHKLGTDLDKVVAAPVQTRSQLLDGRTSLIADMVKTILQHLLERIGVLGLVEQTLALQIAASDVPLHGAEERSIRSVRVHPAEVHRSDAIHQPRLEDFVRLGQIARIDASGANAGGVVFRPPDQVFSIVHRQRIRVVGCSDVFGETTGGAIRAQRVAARRRRRRGGTARRRGSRSRRRSSGSSGRSSGGRGGRSGRARRCGGRSRRRRRSDGTSGRSGRSRRRSSRRQRSRCFRYRRFDGGRALCLNGFTNLCAMCNSFINRKSSGFQSSTEPWSGFGHLAACISRKDVGDFVVVAGKCQNLTTVSGARATQIAGQLKVIRVKRDRRSRHGSRSRRRNLSSSNLRSFGRLAGLDVSDLLLQLVALFGKAVAFASCLPFRLSALSVEAALLCGLVVLFDLCEPRLEIRGVDGRSSRSSRSGHLLRFCGLGFDLISQLIDGFDLVARIASLQLVGDLGVLVNSLLDRSHDFSRSIARRSRDDFISGLSGLNFDLAAGADALRLVTSSSGGRSRRE